MSSSGDEVVAVARGAAEIALLAIDGRACREVTQTDEVLPLFSVVGDEAGLLLVPGEVVERRVAAVVHVVDRVVGTEHALDGQCRRLAVGAAEAVAETTGVGLLSTQVADRLTLEALLPPDHLEHGAGGIGIATWLRLEMPQPPSLFWALYSHFGVEF